VKWWQSGLSTLATQLSAISFVSAPAFVAMKEGGGLKWLAYELGVPIGLIIVMAIIIPTLHRARVISIYEYLEKRYDEQTRALVSVLFQIGRGLGTAVGVLAGGIIVSAALGIPTTTAILAIGVVTIIYDMLGGMEGVIMSDVIQMGFIVVGIIMLGAVAMSMVGWGGAWELFPAERMQVLRFDQFGGSKETMYGFWPMTLGGIFLYASYYGCDQSQVQRELSVGDVPGIRKSLLLNAYGRFPIVLCYCVMGVMIGAVAARPEFFSEIGGIMGTNAEDARVTLQKDPDRLVPLFILSYLPHGIIGFIFVAIVSALMSSLDSALNSLSAVTVQDIYKRYIKRDAEDRHYLIASKLFTAAWGVFAVGMALVFEKVGEEGRKTTLELINAVGSLLYGPILAVFLMGILSKKVSARGVKAGVVAGLGCNLALWLVSSISWLWWNVTGFVAAVVVAVLVSASDHSERRQPELGPLDEGDTNWKLVYGGVVAYFVLLVGVLALLGGV
jgi:SSS family transporter